ncbi:MAG: DUF1653 domain-containing protein [Candidatus Woesearchaeota archaeon]
MAEDIKLGIYEHYKGMRYELIGLARHSETLEELIIYKALYESKDFGKDAIWARPKTMFYENVIINGEEMPRFKLIEEHYKK